jgi:tRNA 2-thiouridine synthesizing protein A
MADRVLDVKGLRCPMPVMKTKKALKEMPAGGTLEVLATDPGAADDFAVLCEITGNELLESSQNGDLLRFVIRRPG